MGNSFGFLRLLFALLVILAHSPEMIDGNRDREILTRLTGSLSFGELAVDGFFLISGYLITQSFERSSSVLEYVAKRVLRIYPGFIVAFLVLLLIVVPLGGGHIDPSGSFLAKAAYNAAILSPLQIDGVFAGLPYPFLDAPMWTIPYEFRCYLLVVVFAALGLNRHRAVYAGVAAALLAVAAVGVHYEIGPVARVTGQLQELCRLLSVFMVGASFYLYRDVVRYDWRIAAGAAVFLAVLLRVPALTETAWAVLGGYLVFWFAFNVRSGWMQNVGRNVDVSYGTYLYAWPIASLIILHDRSISPWTLFAVTSVLAMLAGYVSWHLVEQPFLRLKHMWGSRPASTPTPIGP